MARNFSRSSGRDSSTALSVAPCSTTGLTTWLHHDCAGQDGVNVFARRFTRIPRAWVFADMCKSVDPSPPAPTPVAPRLLLELVGPAALSAIASEIKGIEVRRHDDPDGGPQIVDDDQLSRLSARCRLITRQLRPNGVDYPGRPPSALTLRLFRNRMAADFTVLLAEVGASPIEVIETAIRNQHVTGNGGVAAVVGEPRRRRSNAEILLDKERQLVGDVAAAGRRRCGAAADATAAGARCCRACRHQG